MYHHDEDAIGRDEQNKTIIRDERFTEQQSIKCLELR